MTAADGTLQQHTHLHTNAVRGYRSSLVCGSYLDSMTVQAPHPPSAQPSFVPVKPTEHTQTHTCTKVVSLQWNHWIIDRFKTIFKVKSRSQKQTLNFSLLLFLLPMTSSRISSFHATALTFSRCYPEYISNAHEQPSVSSPAHSPPCALISGFSTANILNLSAHNEAHLTHTVQGELMYLSCASPSSLFGTEAQLFSPFSLWWLAMPECCLCTVWMK